MPHWNTCSICSRKLGGKQRRNLRNNWQIEGLVGIFAHYTIITHDPSYPIIVLRNTPVRIVCHFGHRASFSCM